jgi:hypothetical protein
VKLDLAPSMKNKYNRNVRIYIYVYVYICVASRSVGLYEWFVLLDVLVMSLPKQALVDNSHEWYLSRLFNNHNTLHLDHIISPNNSSTNFSKMLLILSTIHEYPCMLLNRGSWSNKWLQHHFTICYKSWEYFQNRIFFKFSHVIEMSEFLWVYSSSPLCLYYIYSRWQHFAYRCRKWEGLIKFLNIVCWIQDEDVFYSQSQS